MITIVNVSHLQPYPDEEWACYRLDINDSTLCHFHHKPANGLAECLRRAAIQLDAINELERYSRFPNETNTADPEVPNEKDGLRCEEVLQAEADEAEAGLEEKDLLAEGLQGLEGEPGHKAFMLALWLGDRDREQRELASSLRAQNFSNLVKCDPGV